MYERISVIDKKFEPSGNVLFFLLPIESDYYSLGEFKCHSIICHSFSKHPLIIVADESDTFLWLLKHKYELFEKA